MLYLLNAFSLNMIDGFPASIQAEEMTANQVREALDGGFVSAVGHADTATVFGDVLQMDIASNRATVFLAKGKIAVVGQYIGPRLPEGAKHLPEGATIKWLRVSIS